MSKCVQCGKHVYHYSHKSGLCDECFKKLKEKKGTESKDDVL